MLRKRDRRNENFSEEPTDSDELRALADRQVSVSTRAGECEPLYVDLEGFLATLSPRMRELCHRLKTQSWNAALKAMHLSADLMPKLQRELREQFSKAGFSPADLTR